jgi:hypothetical protein
MRTADDLLVHVGYQKSGTSWLQQDVFGSPHQRSFCQPWDRGLIPKVFVAPSDFEFDPCSAARILAQNDSIRGNVPSAPVLSHERLCGSPFSGGYDSKGLADRLYATLPGAKILIVIRNQAGILLSTYKQYVRLGGTRSLHNYLCPPRLGRMRIPQFTLAFYEYHRLINYYQDLFGADRVLVLPFEMMVADALAFVGRIAAFVGVQAPSSVSAAPRNVALSGASTALKRPLNFLFVRDTINPSALIESPRLAGWVHLGIEAFDGAVPVGLRAASDRKLSSSLRAVTTGRFAESNQLTVSLTGVDLATHGYEV